MGLDQALERHGLGRWKNETSQVRMTRDEFLDLVAFLIKDDTEVRAHQLDVETLFERRREGAVWTVLALKRAGLLNKKAGSLVTEWESRRLADNLPDLMIEDVQIIPP